MSEHDARVESAIQKALAARAGNMLTIAKGYFPGINAAGYIKVCPFCEAAGNKFSVRPKAGLWRWGCEIPTCPAHFDSLRVSGTYDTIGLIATMEKCDRPTATDRLLEMAGVEKPVVQEPEEEPNCQLIVDSSKGRKGKKAKADAEDEIPGVPTSTAPPSPTPPPDEEEAPAEKSKVWARLHQLLTLTPSDAAKLRKERGFDEETIRRGGFKSSNPKNRELLAPLLEEFPPGVLLSTGIAVKEDEGGMKINAQLCGYGLVKRATKTEPDVWGGTNPILIPYRDADGDVCFIRPHKGGLSGKAFMREQGFEIGFRSARTRSHLYTNSLFDKRQDGWEKRIVLTEGEFKGEALAQAGIPAAAVPGIQMPRNDIFFEAMVERFRRAGVKEITVCYDNEDKSHKADPWIRHDAKVYALYACHALRAVGFHTSFLQLPDEWRDAKGKADWDGALAKFGTGAAAKFTAVLKKAKPYYPQTELFAPSEEERVVHCKLNRLLHTPQILSGGEEESELARLILKTPAAFRLPKDGLPPIAARELAKELDSTLGCYYVRKRPPEQSLPRWYELAGEIRKKIKSTPDEDLETMAGLEAAMAAVNHILEGRPEILSDFTISCDFQVRTQTGEIHRLFKFRNKHGQVSENITVPPAACSTSTKFREFCMGIGNYNPKIGDKQLQELMQDLGSISAWREIRELEMIGRDPESNLWIFGDCAYTKDGDVLFADDHDIIWHNGVGYRIDPQDLEHFVHKIPPRFFQKIGKTPKEVHTEIIAAPDKEAAAVARIFFQQTADFIASFGGVGGLLASGNILSYAAAPEILKLCKGHAGAWIHGRMSAGKTEMARFLMMTWGYDAEFRTQVSGGGTTAVSIDRFLAQYSDIPVNIDEFREKEADATRNGTLRACFNRQSKSKGRMDQTNRTRAVQPRTSPIVTGEGVTSDGATLSRYIGLVLSKDRRMGTPEQQAKRYARMCRDQYQYHRIVRYVMMNRQWFGKEIHDRLEAFLMDKEVIAAIPQERLRLTHGMAWASFTALFDRLIGYLPAVAEMAKEDPDTAIAKEDLILLRDSVSSFRQDTITYAKDATSDVASINFVIRFWQNIVTGLSVEHEMRKFIKFERCQISETNRVIPLATKIDIGDSVRCILVRSQEIYALYEKFMRSRGQSPDLSMEGIRGEIRRENYWVPAPSDMRNKSHRISKVWGDDGQQSCWVLRCDKMEPTLQQVFADHFDCTEQDDSLGF